jgi:integrase/recombinase XerC
MQPEQSMTMGAGEAQGQNMDLIEMYLEHLRRAGRSLNTIEDRRVLLYRIHRELTYGLDGASDVELKEWLYRDEWSQNTKATFYNGLKSFYGWATNPRDPWLTVNPMEDLEPVSVARGLARPVTDEQLHRMLTEAAQPYRLWATIAAYQGLRCVEISRLDRQDITEERLIVVKGKGGYPRVHDTHPDVWAAVKDLPPGPVARLKSGERASPRQVSNNASVYFQRTMGMEGVALHRCRHWLGVTTQRLYRDIRVTQETLGHRSLTSTQVYTAASNDPQREARSMLPRLAG